MTVEELVAEVVRLRQERGLTQKQLEEMSGVRQPVIARIETGTVTPRLRTLVRLLLPLGKKLAVVSMD